MEVSSPFRMRPWQTQKAGRKIKPQMKQAQFFDKTDEHCEIMGSLNNKHSTSFMENKVLKY